MVFLWVCAMPASFFFNLKNFYFLRNTGKHYPQIFIPRELVETSEVVAGCSSAGPQGELQRSLGIEDDIYMLVQVIAEKQCER